MDKNWIINDNVSDWMTPRPAPAIPGGVYNSPPTPEDGSLVVPGSTATISAHAVDNSGQGLNYVNITETIEGQNQNNPWPILKTQSFSGNTPIADVSASF
jgi:hypothetical protein